MVLLAVGEWARFGRQVITYSADAPPRVEQLGVKERDAPERIHDYWASVGHPERSGMDDVAWSAAFISWVVRRAGSDALIRHWPGQPAGLAVVSRLAGLTAG